MNPPEGTSIIFVRFDKGEPEVLLLLRDDNSQIPYPNCWDILGGHVETGETPADCIAREMQEEIGIDIGAPELFRKYYFDDRIEHTYYLVSNLNIQDIHLTEGQALRWFSEQEIRNMRPEKFAFGFRAVLFDFFKFYRTGNLR